MADGYTIQIYVPDGDPNGVRVISDKIWTGLGIAFPRSKLTELAQRTEIKRMGIYILVGYQDENDLPTIYVGQADNVGDRIANHDKQKVFWDRGIAFVSKGDELHRGNVTWLEHSLLRRATEANRCKLDNGVVPKEPHLSESEKADAEDFLNRIFRILPLVNLHAFEFPKAIVTPNQAETTIAHPKQNVELDTIVVPAQLDGFNAKTSYEAGSETGHTSRRRHRGHSTAHRGNAC